jgi:hypothetical protein
MLMDEQQPFARFYGVEKSKDKSVKCMTERGEGKYEEKDAIMKNWNSQYRGSYRN